MVPGVGSGVGQGWVWVTNRLGEGVGVGVGSGLGLYLAPGLPSGRQVDSLRIAHAAYVAQLQFPAVLLTLGFDQLRTIPPTLGASCNLYHYTLGASCNLYHYTLGASCKLYNDPPPIYLTPTITHSLGDSATKAPHPNHTWLPHPPYPHPGVSPYPPTQGEAHVPTQG